MILAQLVTLAPPPVQVSTGQVASVAAAIVLVIGAMVTGALQIIREIRATKALVQDNATTGAAAGQVRDTKLNRIEVLVDGRYGEVLQELADMKQLLAKSTGLAADQTLAENAQKRANVQQAQVVIADSVAKKETP